MAPLPPCGPPRSPPPRLLLLLLLLSATLLGAQARAEPAAGSAVPAQSRPCVDCHAFEFMQRALQDLRKTAYSLDARFPRAPPDLECPLGMHLEPPDAPAASPPWGAGGAVRTEGSLKEKPEELSRRTASCCRLSAGPCVPAGRPGTEDPPGRALTNKSLVPTLVSCVPALATSAHRRPLESLPGPGFPRRAALPPWHQARGVHPWARWPPPSRGLPCSLSALPF
ncbi:NELL2-interacting cell ontogeny regulator 1 isoform X2 [Bubalus kerabau]|nr:neuropeptide-like protein C4orf48 homolog isoform X2 [Bubalus carabanensis]XP_055443517.1 neuropeptide-like protein C4orf48 homolog isoform X2 [Bubalus carabanensis]